MGMFDDFDPTSLLFGIPPPPTDMFGGGGSSGGDAAGAAGAAGAIGGGLAGLSAEEGQDKAGELDVNKAYGFGGGNDSKFNAMRKSQLGMGRQGS